MIIVGGTLFQSLSSIETVPAQSQCLGRPERVVVGDNVAIRDRVGSLCNHTFERLYCTLHMAIFWKRKIAAALKHMADSDAGFIGYYPQNMGAELIYARLEE